MMSLRASLLAATVLAAAPVLAADLPARKSPAFAAPESFSQWQIRVRALAVIPQEELKFDGQPTYNGYISNSYVPELDITYYFTKNIAAELVLGTTPHKVRGTEAIHGLQIGKSWLLPPTLTLQYHFTDFGAFKPYVGAGVNYTFFLGTSPSRVVDPGIAAGANINQFKLDNSFGFALQAGFDYMLTKNWGVNIDVKKLWLRSDFTANLQTNAAAVNALTGQARIDPWLVGTGVTYRF
jgi:outer membrane protein